MPTAAGRTSIEEAREREDLLYRMLCDLARGQRALPRIPEFGPTLGITGHGSVYNILARLQTAGRIVVEGTAGRKVIHIPALGLSVASGTNPDGGCRRPVMEFVELVARVACLSVEEITGKKRSRLELRPRYVVIRLARAEGWSYQDIGDAIGRDHTSVMSGWERSEELLPCDKLFARLMRRAEAELRGLPEPAFVVRLRPALPPAPASRHPIEVDEDDWHQTTDLHRRLRGSSRLIAAIRREHPDRCAA